MSSRRQWSYDEKLRLVRETLRSGETVAGVARRHGVTQQSLFNWRRKSREGRLARTGNSDGTRIYIKWKFLNPYLSRHQQSLWAAAEAAAIGLGGIKLVSNVTGISKPTIARGIRKLGSTKGSPAGSLIFSGGSARSGRPPNEIRDPHTLLTEDADPAFCDCITLRTRNPAGGQRARQRRSPSSTSKRQPCALPFLEISCPKTPSGGPDRHTRSRASVQCKKTHPEPSGVTLQETTESCGAKSTPQRLREKGSSPANGSKHQPDFAR